MLDPYELEEKTLFYPEVWDASYEYEAHPPEPSDMDDITCVDDVVEERVVFLKERDMASALPQELFC